MIVPYWSRLSSVCPECLLRATRNRAITLPTPYARVKQAYAYALHMCGLFSFIGHYAVRST